MNAPAPTPLSSQSALPQSALPKPVRVALLGCGNVGAALAELILRRRSHIAAKFGVDIHITAAAVRNPHAARKVALPPEIFTTDAAAAAGSDNVDVVVELIGGLHPARELLLAALQDGKSVVTANKELLAAYGPELASAASASGAKLLFEAAVGGGIPLIRALSESLAGESVRRVMGIVNGTTNYILGRMSEDGVGYAEALAEAQGRGYAEEDPTADVEGHDAAAKVAIMASIAFGGSVKGSDVHREGIAQVSVDDIVFARRLGYAIKLLGIAERSGDGEDEAVAVHVHPAMLALTHPLASVRGSFNAVFIEGEAVGELMLYGRGAGGRPTASAVLGDLIDAAQTARTGRTAHLVGGERAGTTAQNKQTHAEGRSTPQAVDETASRTDRPPRQHAPTGGNLQPLLIRPIEELQTAYYLSLEVDDRPGVLAAVAGVFGSHGVSILSMEQEGLGSEARLIFITHTAREKDMRSTISGLRGLDAVRRVGSVIRVITEDQ